MLFTLGDQVLLGLASNSWLQAALLPGPCKQPGLQARISISWCIQRWISSVGDLCEMHTQCVSYTVSPYHDCHWASSHLRQCCCSLWNSSMDWRNWAHSLGRSQELHFTRAVQLGSPHFHIHWPDWVTCFMVLRVEDNSISHPPPTQSQGASFQLSLTSRSLLQGFILAYKFPFLLIYIFPCTRLYIHPHPFLPSFDIWGSPSTVVKSSQQCWQAKKKSFSVLLLAV